MIYSMYWQGMQHTSYHIPGWMQTLGIDDLIGKNVNVLEEVAVSIKESVDDSFVFIILNSNMEAFNKWLTRYGLTDMEVFRSNAITNPVHTYKGRNLTLVVLASESHAWRDMFTNEFETEEGEL